MGHDIRLTDPVTRETLHAEHPHQLAGGTYCQGGTTEMWLSVTYNYSVHYKKLGDQGIMSIYGMTGAESLPILQGVIDALGDDVHHDYWEPTEGNAKAALLKLKAMAQMRPDGVWDGD